MAKKSKSKNSGSTIARNKKATHEYFIESKYEAGLVLEGWEVKSLRAGRVNITEGYVVITKSEAFVIGINISPLISASTHVRTQPVRQRKLLLHRHELSKLIGLIERQGYTLVALSMYWKRGRAKIEIGVGKGKKMHDKRASLKEKDWKRDKERIFKNG